LRRKFGERADEAEVTIWPNQIAGSFSRSLQTRAQRASLKFMNSDADQFAPEANQKRKASQKALSPFRRSPARVPGAARDHFSDQNLKSAGTKLSLSHYLSLPVVPSFCDLDFSLRHL
jgi:hypothetical protein